MALSDLNQRITADKVAQTIRLLHLKLLLLQQMEVVDEVVCRRGSTR
jgi:hypothetical protein